MRNRTSAESIQSLTNAQPGKKQTPEECYEQGYEEFKKESIQQLKASGQHGPYAEQDLVPMGLRMTLKESCGLNDATGASNEEKPVAPAKIAHQSNQQPIENPSFDCAKASSGVEKMICAEEDLAKLDVELSKVYSSRFNQAPDEAKKSMRGAQLEWLKTRRNICMDVACLKKEYNARIEEVSIVKF